MCEDDRNADRDAARWMAEHADYECNICGSRCVASMTNRCPACERYACDQCWDDGRMMCETCVIKMDDREEL